MIEGIRCPPGTHKYRPLGKVLYCSGCADVQPLLLEVDDAGSSGRETPHAPEVVAYEPPEPTPADLEAHIHRLRQAAGLADRDAEQQHLFGQRHEFDGDLSDLEVIQRSNEREWPRVRVDEGYRTDAADDTLPSAGL